MNGRGNTELRPQARQYVGARRQLTLLLKIESFESLLGSLLREPRGRIVMAAVQVELRSLEVGLGLLPPGLSVRSHGWGKYTGGMGQTIAQKILARASGRARVEPGEIVWCKVDLDMAHD